MVVVAAAEIDALTAPALLSDIMAAAAAGYLEVIVDCAAVTFLGAAAVGALSEARRRLADIGVGLVVRSPTPRLVWMLDMFGLTELSEDTSLSCPLGDVVGIPSSTTVI